MAIIDELIPMVGHKMADDWIVVWWNGRWWIVVWWLTLLDDELSCDEYGRWWIGNVWSLWQMMNCRVNRTMADDELYVWIMNGSDDDPVVWCQWQMMNLIYCDEMADDELVVWMKWQIDEVVVWVKFADDEVKVVWWNGRWWIVVWWNEPVYDGIVVWWNGRWWIPRVIKYADDEL